ncbi:MAG: Uma2 family endonuclease [Planctomycetaceae bacterium]
MTAEELIARFGPIPLWRIRVDPPPGMATEADVIRIHDREDRTCELIDGILIQKDMNAFSSVIEAWIGSLIGAFVRPRRLGFVLDSSEVLRLAENRLRAPDVSFIRRDQTPGGRFPREPIPDLYPTLAVEVLSPGNTKREMSEKLDDYFGAGSELVWLVDPATRSVRVFTARDAESTLNIGDLLDGGSALPGFSVPVAELFGVLELGEEA